MIHITGVLILPATCGFEELEVLRWHECCTNYHVSYIYRTREWHKRVTEHVRILNEEKGFVVATMMDTEGSEINSYGRSWWCFIDLLKLKQG
jgi:uncharacterized Fe-S cluster-containing protein